MVDSKNNIKIINKFHNSESGAVAIIVAIAIVVIIIVVGMAIDYNRQLNFEMELRDAADTAALQGASYDEKKVNKEALATRGYVLSKEEHDEERLKIAEQAYAEIRAKLLTRYPGYTIDELDRGSTIYQDGNDTIYIDGDKQTITISPNGTLPATFMSVPSILKGGDARTLYVGGTYAAAYNSPNPIPAAIEIIVDNTGSMQWAADPNYTYPQYNRFGGLSEGVADDGTAPPIDIQRITVLENVLNDLLDILDGTQAQFTNTAEEIFYTGLIAFAQRGNNSKAWILADLEGGTQHVRDSLSQVNADGGTDYAEGLKLAVREYKTFRPTNENTRKFLILMTDGANNLREGKQATNDAYVYALDYCQELAGMDVTIYTIAFMLEENLLPPFYYDKAINDPDYIYAQANLDKAKANLKQCAEYTTNGKFFNANSNQELQEAFLEIAEEVSEKVVKLVE